MTTILTSVGGSVRRPGFAMSQSPSSGKAAVLVILSAVLVLAGLGAVGVHAGLPHPTVPRQLMIPERDCGLLQHFASLDELKGHLRENPRGWPWIFGDGRPVTAAAGPGAATPASVPYSGTNNQVAGVDEADIVKTDGTYIYSASWNASKYGSDVSIVRAYPPSTAA